MRALMHIALPIVLASLAACATQSPDRPLTSAQQVMSSEDDNAVRAAKS